MSTPAHEELVRRFKTAAENLRTDDNGSLATNEGSLDKEQYTVRKPPELSEGTLDARWGTAPPARPLNYNGDYSTGVEAEAKDGRSGVLERIFKDVSAMRAADKAVISKNFDHGSSGNYEAHSALLEKTKTAEAEDGSLTDRVRAVAGRH